MTTAGSVEERFFSQVSKDGPVSERNPELGQCWLWTGPKTRDGAGIFKHELKQLAAHRVSLELSGRAAKPDEIVLPLCGNRACVRPTHLNPVPRTGGKPWRTFIGQRFGMLEVIGRAEEMYGKRACMVRCDCGTVKSVAEFSLKSKNVGTRSCGCLIGVLHGQTRRGQKSPTYRSWLSMNKRCYDSAAINFADYGGRGISVCDEWKSPGGFGAFLHHAGERPSQKHSIDRIDVDGNYEPGNVRWATSKEQNRNRRNNAKLTVDGVTLTKAEWAERSGLTIAAMAGRLKRGWSVDQAIKTPLRVARGPKLGIAEMRALRRFVNESNRIEGIVRAPHAHELRAHESLLALPELRVADIENFINIVAGAPLRRSRDQRVTVGRHVPPPGGPELIHALELLLLAVNMDAVTPYEAHCRFETIHCAMDGNGRSGRAVWLWHKKKRGEDPFRFGFLRGWYYDSLDAHESREPSPTWGRE